VGNTTHDSSSIAVYETRQNLSTQGKYPSIKKTNAYKKVLREIKCKEKKRHGPPDLLVAV
jgi:hypothetical protein